MKLVQVPSYPWIPLTIVKTGQSVGPDSVERDRPYKGTGDPEYLGLCGRGEHGLFGHLEKTFAGRSVLEAGGEAPWLDEHLHDGQGVVENEVVCWDVLGYPVLHDQDHELEQGPIFFFVEELDCWGVHDFAEDDA